MISKGNNNLNGNKKNCEKCPKTDFFSGPYFPVFVLNTEIYGVNLCIQFEVNLRIQFEYRKIFGHFSRSQRLPKIIHGIGSKMLSNYKQKMLRTKS